MNPKFVICLEEWYAANGRALPWRQTRDAYRIWVSEVILQQTRVEQGRDYYERFIRRFPTVEALAAASEDEVLRMWQGLGYYSRARNLHAAARQVVAMGGFPQEFKQIKALKGVGEYTAAAIASFAFNRPHAVVDGNVYRVLSRYLDEATPIDSTQGKKLFAALADEMLDRAQPALYNQALMDFGALHCKVQSPLCDTCPLADTCAALAAHTVDERPVKARRTRVTDRYLTYIFVTNAEGSIQLQRREGDDIWRGLWQFPLIEGNLAQVVATSALDKDGLLLSSALKKRLGEKVCTLEHQLSHQRLHADFYRLDLLLGEASPFAGEWVAPANLDRYALPRLLTRFIDKQLIINQTS